MYPTNFAVLYLSRYYTPFISKSRLFQKSSSELQREKPLNFYIVINI